MKITLFKAIALAFLAVLALSGTASASEKLDQKTVADAYVYLLGRAIVIRQEHTDLKEPGISYMIIKYSPVGSADFVNPNLDVAYLETWIAVDEQTPVLLEVPEVKGRYYPAQILDEWGEVITTSTNETIHRLRKPPTRPQLSEVETMEDYCKHHTKDGQLPASSGCCVRQFGSNPRTCSA